MVGFVYFNYDMINMFQLSMPRNANVFLHFGPYDSFGEVKHRTDRLDGMQGMNNST